MAMRRELRIAIFLMLEAWAKVEADVRHLNPQEHRRIQRLREDWGRSLEHFVQLMEERDSIQTSKEKPK